MSIEASNLNCFCNILLFFSSNPLSHLLTENGGFDTITSNFINVSFCKCNGFESVSPHCIFASYTLCKNIFILQIEYDLLLISCPYKLTFFVLASLYAFNNNAPEPQAGSYILSFSFGATNFAMSADISIGV